MEHYLILARSVTYAQRMEKLLTRTGIHCQIFRAPRDLTNLGCAYAVRIFVQDLTKALSTLHRAGLGPVQVFLYQHGVYQEVDV